MFGNGGGRMQSFGGPWTLLKLNVLDKYLNFYVTAMQRKTFRLCYFDAFAGSGNIDIKDIGPIPGSALKAIDYPFDKYFFIEKSEDYAHRLDQNIIVKSKNKNINYEIIIGDCNELLQKINSFQWYKNYWRGVIFLDPYAMELKWDSLESIAKTEAFDVWYLFPLSAMNRLMRRDGNIEESHRAIINDLLGTIDWEEEIYYESPQLSLFGEQDRERVHVTEIEKYVIKRLKTIFPGVSDKSKLLRNPVNNSPMFILCFAVSNPSPKAIKISLKIADHILTHT